MSVLLILILRAFSRCRDNHRDDIFHNDIQHNGQSEITSITFMCFIELPLILDVVELNVIGQSVILLSILAPFSSPC